MTGGLDAPLDVLAIGAHPDDVELACGGTLARLAAAGKRVGIVHLTRGEAGTRGTPEERAGEATAAAEALGCVAMRILDCGDAGLRHGPAEEEALIELLRLLRPEVVLAPPPVDRHPDHGRAHRLVVDAAFYAGVARRGGGRGHAGPHRPAALFTYMQHDGFEPSFVVDVGPYWETKLAALACYRSQLHQPGAERREPPTKVASREFALAVEGRARHFGQAIGVELGEPFASRTPLAVHDLLAVVPRGLR